MLFSLEGNLRVDVGKCIEQRGFGLGEIADLQVVLGFVGEDGDYVLGVGEEDALLAHPLRLAQVLQRTGRVDSPVKSGQVKQDFQVLPAGTPEVLDAKLLCLLEQSHSHHGKVNLLA